jgi:signal transduction histidine kinase
VGRVVRPPSELAFEEVVREALFLSQGRVAERGARIDVAPDLPHVWGDRARLVEVVQNLVDNAVKFSASRPEPHVEIGQRRQAGQPTVLFVRDDGIGIAPEHLEGIFTLFRKLDPRSEGTGIGLALAKRIVEVHGGRIWAESDGPGTGATFCFTLAPMPPS